MLDKKTSLFEYPGNLLNFSLIFASYAGFLSTLSYQSSTLILSVVTWDRLISVTRPLQPRSSSRIRYNIICSIIMQNKFITSPRIITSCAHEFVFREDHDIAFFICIYLLTFSFDFAGSFIITIPASIKQFQGIYCNKHNHFFLTFFNRATLRLSVLWLVAAACAAAPFFDDNYFGEHFYGTNGVCLSIHIHDPLGQVCVVLILKLLKSINSPSEA